VLAALREDDAERPARDFRVVEEQLVEIAKRQPGLTALISKYCAIIGVRRAAVSELGLSLEASIASA